MNPSHPYLSAGIFIILLPFCALAQTKEDASPPVILRFLFLEESNESYAMETTEGLLPVSSHPYAISPPVQVPAGESRGIMRLLPPLPGEDPNAPPRKLKIAEIKPSAKDTDLLVVMVPNEDGTRYRSRIYNSSEEVFPAGALRVINLCSQEIAVDLDGKLTRISPWTLSVMAPKPDIRNRVIAKVVLKEDNQWRLLYDSILFFRKNQRTTGVVVFSPSGMRHTYTEGEIQEYGGIIPPRHQWLTYQSSVSDKN